MGEALLKTNEETRAVENQGDRGSWDIVSDIGGLLHSDAISRVSPME